VRIVRPTLPLALALAAAACQGLPEPTVCGLIPANGCPMARGGSCADRACAAIYRCEESGWQLVQTCSPHADAGAALEAADGRSCSDVTVSFEASTGCAPPLAHADCPLEVALGCPETACVSGCADFFVCRADGWQLAAWCDDVTGALLWVDGL
jgi:hypothetical protein